MSDQENNITNEPNNVYTQPQGAQTIIINQAPAPVVKRNGMGVAGFVLALIGLFFSWVPIFGWIVWGLGLLFSFIGVFKAPRGLSIAGLVISVVGIIVLLSVASMVWAYM